MLRTQLDASCATREFGFNATTDKVHVHDLHATILHLLGFDHTKLTYRFQGRDFRLTDVHGNVVTKLLVWGPFCCGSDLAVDDSSIGDHSD